MATLKVSEFSLDLFKRMRVKPAQSDKTLKKLAIDIIRNSISRGEEPRKLVGN
jgi:hypothetical protein